MIAKPGQKPERCGEGGGIPYMPPPLHRGPEKQETQIPSEVSSMTYVLALQEVAGDTTVDAPISLYSLFNC
jgi:hypothetical protein